MTDHPRRLRRWIAAALVAPASAAVFLGATSWASGHDVPTTSSNTQPKVAGPSRSQADHQLKVLQRQLRVQSRVVARLSRQVTAVRARAAALTAAANAAPSSTGTVSVAGPAPAAPAPQSQQASQPVAAQPAPAPTTHTTTGASGAPK